MTESTIIPEFSMYTIEDEEQQELAERLALMPIEIDRFRRFTDVLLEYALSGKRHNHSDGFLSMVAKACYLRGMYGDNLILAKGSDCVVCKGFAAASYCRQSLNPRWINNLTNYVNQAFQQRNYVAYADLGGVLAQILAELGYLSRAKNTALEIVEKTIEETKYDIDLKKRVQAALLDLHIVLAHVANGLQARDEALLRLDSAQNTAKYLDHQIALAKILYERAIIMFERHEYIAAESLLNKAGQKFEAMGYLEGIANVHNLRGVIFTYRGQFQDARDEFEELLMIYQKLNNQIGLVKALVNIGEVDRSLGQLEQMELYNRKALELSKEAEYMAGISTATLNLGDVALRKGEFDKAIEQYRKAAELFSRSGMVSNYVLTQLLIGDTYYLKRIGDKAIEAYDAAKKLALASSFPLSAFLADVSKLTFYRMNGLEVPEDLRLSICDFMGPSSKWIEGDGNIQMRNLRRAIFEDDAIESSRCVFYNSALIFECRVERTLSKKECFGNLYWLRKLCPYFRSFSEWLDSLNNE